MNMNMFSKGRKNTITINGVTIETNGSSNISVNGDSVYVGGKLIKSGLSGIVKIEFEGDLAKLQTDGSATINGDVKGNVDCGGSCQCGNVGGFVDAGGSVTCGNVKGDVDAGGSVRMVK